MRWVGIGGGLALLACTGAPPAPPTEWPVDAAQVASLQQQVEALRERRFLQPVPVTTVTEGRAALIVADELRQVGVEELHAQEALAHALGLLPRTTSLVPSLLALYRDSVAGFYSGTTRRLYVVEGVDPLAEDQAALLVHELTHAYQDQHAALLQVLVGLRERDDLAFALGALLEGDALWTELSFEAEKHGDALPPPEDVAHQFDTDALIPAGTPRLLRDAFVGQYPAGYALATRLAERGGPPALDAALEDPPLSSEELLHPERYLNPLRRRSLADLSAPAAAFAPGCSDRARNSFGELGLRVFGREAGQPEASVRGAADGWDGDQAWLLDCDAPAFAWLVQLDSGRDARELEALLRAAAPVLTPDAAVTREGRRVLLAAGLPPEARRWLLTRLPERRYPTLARWLEAHPEVLERARELRARSQAPRS